MSVLDHPRPEGWFSSRTCLSTLVTLRLQCLGVMEIIIELLPGDWILHGVHLSLVALTVQPLTVLWVLAVLMAVPATWSCLRVSAILLASQ